jgi:hypothetical protein
MRPAPPQAATNEALGLDQVPEAVHASLVLRTAALPHWPAVPTHMPGEAAESGGQLAWNTCVPGYGGRLVFTSPGDSYGPSMRPDDWYPYPTGWRYLLLNEWGHR